MANTKVTTNVIADDAITTAKIADDVALGGNPTTTTQSAGNSTTRVATTAFVSTAVTNLIGGAPGALDTLNELAAAINDDASINTTLTNSIATKLPLAGGTLTGDLILGDSVKLEIGSASGGDLQIYHDASNSYISDAGTGMLIIKSSNIEIHGTDGGKLAGMWSEGRAALYYNNAEKFRTVSGGVDVTGYLASDALASPDGTQIVYLTNSAMVGINHASNTWGRLNVHENSATVSSLVLSQGSGSGSALEINDGNTDQSGNLFKVTGAGNTTIAGTLGVTGIISPTTHIDMPDNARIRLGAQPDLQIFHNGTDSYVQDTGTGSLMLAGSAVFITNADASETYIRGVDDGAVTLYYDNAAKLATKSDGVLVTGELQATTLDINGNSHLDGTLQITGNFYAGDNDILNIGSSNDLQIYHDGSNSYIDETATGSLRIRSSDIQLEKYTGEMMLVGNSDGAVTLYHDGSSKLATVAGGIDVTGTVVCDGGNFDGAATFNDTGADADFRVESENQAHMFFIDAANDRIGIGTNTPAHMLNLVSSGDAGIHIMADSDNSGEGDNPYISMSQDGSTAQQFVIGMEGDANVHATGLLNNAPFIRANNDASQPFQIAHMDSVVATFRSGKVGIGTNDPTHPLEIKTTADGTLLFLNRHNVSGWDFSISNTSTLTGVGSGALEFIPQNGSTANEFAIGKAGTTTALFHVKNDQNSFAYKVGIGTGANTIITNLVVADNVNGRVGIHLVNTNTTAAAYAQLNLGHEVGGFTGGYVSHDYAGNMKVWNRDNDPLMFATNDTERMRILSDGETLVGTTSTMAVKFGVTQSSATVNATDTSASSASYTGTLMVSSVSRNTTDNTYHFWKCQRRGYANSVLVDSGGSFTTANNSYGAISDQRLKTDIIDSGSQWDDIKALRVRKYKMIQDPESNVHLGVISQELEASGMNGLVQEKDADEYEIAAVDDESILKEGDKTKSVRYSVLYMKAIKALQEAQTRIETLETKVEALEE